MSDWNRNWNRKLIDAEFGGGRVNCPRDIHKWIVVQEGGCRKIVFLCPCGNTL